MTNKKIILGIVIIASVLVFTGCKENKKVETEKATGTNTTGTPAKQPKVENPKELKIEPTEEAKSIADKVEFSNIQTILENNITTITGMVKNSTDKEITPYMNIYFYDSNKSIVVTANAFVDKLAAGESKQFVTSVTGDYTGLEMKAELATLEK